MVVLDITTPTNCLTCPMIHACAEQQNKSIEALRKMKKRPIWCPIKGEIKSGNGDLIARTPLRRKVHSWYLTSATGTEDWYQANVALKLIDSAPPVVEGRGNDRRKNSN